MTSVLEPDSISELEDDRSSGEDAEYLSDAAMNEALAQSDSDSAGAPETDSEPEAETEAEPESELVDEPDAELDAEPETDLEDSESKEAESDADADSDEEDFGNGVGLEPGESRPPQQDTAGHTASMTHPGSETDVLGHRVQSEPILLFAQPVAVQPLSGESHSEHTRVLGYTDTEYTSSRSA